MSPGHNDGPVIGARHHPLEAEADRIADRTVGVRTAGSSAAALRVQRVDGYAGARGDRAPASVEHVLDGPARPLDPALREDMEQRFGHPLTRVRVHADAAAAKSAADVDARAYTVGDDIVFGAGEFAPATSAGQRLIAHEVAHVLQQSGSRGYLQRASPEQPHASAGTGLDQRDCSTRVTDVFWLGPTSVEGGRPECGFAEIHLLKDMGRSGYVRADYPLPAIPCKRGDTKKHGVLLQDGSNEWLVLEIRAGGIDVVNACGDEETLGIAGEPPPKPAPGPPPDTSVEVKDGTLGAGRVETWDGCKRVVFTPEKAGPTRVYNLQVVMQPRLGEMKIYVIEGGDKIPYAPKDLEGMLGVVLTGDKCGEPLPPRPPVEPEQLPGTFSD